MRGFLFSNNYKQVDVLRPLGYNIGWRLVRKSNLERMCSILIKISPSVFACDFARLGEEILAMEKAGADMIHLDVMDGNFVPNISFGPPVISALRKKTGIFFDVHLMISNPLKYIDAFVEAGADLIMFHAESDSDIRHVLGKIKQSGIKAGIAIKPKTPPEVIREFLPALQMVLVMTVEPGFGGQKFMADMMPKVKILREWAIDANPGLDIEVDGGIDVTTVKVAAKAGANVFVAGSSLFSATDYPTALKELREAAESAFKS